MTKKDYKTLAGVFNFNHYEEFQEGDTLYTKEAKRKEYFRLLRRLINAIQRNDEGFDSDKFMQETDKIE